MQTIIKPPYYIRLSMILLMLMLLGTLLYLGQSIIVPFAFSALFGVLLLPVSSYLEKRMPRPLAILLTLFAAFLLIIGLLYFLSTQVAAFVEDSEEITRQLNQHWRSVQRWVQQNFGVSRSEQLQYIDQTVENMKKSGSSFLTSTFSSLSSWLLLVTLLPIYTFLLLYYRDLIRKFIIDQFSDEHKPKVSETLHASMSVGLNYMVGLLIEMVIVATINTIGFLIIGIKYAIFLGVFAAILNLIPYIGMLVASVFCALVTLTNSPDLAPVIWVIVVLIAVQFFDNNIIMPRVVGSKVKINALVTILGVLIGGALCGVAGMFLSIPAIAILKIIFERIDGMQPWGRLLGDGTEGRSTRKK